MKQHGRYLVLLVIATAAFFICLLNAKSPEALMMSPANSDEYSAIRSAIEDRAGKPITLRAPSTGDYQSAITFVDIFGDLKNEAIAFYRESGDDTSIRMCILTEENGKWVAGEPVLGHGSDILQLAFGDMNGDGVREVVVGWNLLDSRENRFLSVYSCWKQEQDVRTTEAGSLFYTEMITLDMSGGGESEILVISNRSLTNNTYESAVASLYYMNEHGELEIRSNAFLDGGVTSYAAIQNDRLDGRSRVLIDGIVGENAMMTELLYWDPERESLVSPLYDAQQNVSKATIRLGSMVCRDINGDGVLEIPFDEALPASDDVTSELNELNAADETNRLVSWHVFDDASGEYEYVQGSVVSEQDKFIFLFPENWRNKVTVQHDNTKNVWSFYEWDFAENKLLKILLDIQVLSANEWENGNFAFVKAHYGMVYTATIMTASSQLSITAEQIESGFIIFE